MSIHSHELKETAVKVADADFAIDRREHTTASAVRDYWAKVRAGELGSLPAVFGLVSLIVLFTALRPETFLSERNIANLFVQAMSVTILALGLVFVLLLGEIDLSAGVTSGVCAAVMAKLMVEAGQPWYTAVLAALLTGLLIGAVIGLLVAVVRIPSFVVTLALFLGLQGITLRLIGEGGTVPVRDEVIVALANDNMPIWLGWTLAVGCSVLFAASQLLRRHRQRSRGLIAPPLGLVVGRIAVVTAALLGITFLMGLDRAPSPTVVLNGVPWGVPLVALLVITATFVLGRTVYGRHVYAVGGNAEAARRAGINVTAIRMSVFMIASTLAAVAGMVDASRLNSVTPDAGAGNVLLYAVGAAVIGGTSLFGGKGRAIDAVLGGLVISVIANGLGLLGAQAYLNMLITGGVLLLAASVDALARRRRVAVGR
ncbi:inner-membrane translocator [Thermomonospora curvata DSM 43183]|uniref:Xylose transport system permease protein XylH n=1 Tax=Thermomonospora curvata (strain ATCC 19995 / DSM 43183 / JCM 3096 / KCTC 9072 / NBRC 15933 / NCIMB 10081 / Henssen B9) TaxID=471852 RepID=D1A5S9_THECD|nr:inner-membrane translocator [Thermomonospora curvata DSM 43183]PKK13991.1 MAG: ABC transporter permease [Thermomonospora sp. CIF 1]